ncbi:3D domain-containing protein [Bacillus sp. T33-2]|uniref:3D domain-containing protein n=1 Tax=Bacillus sp. T33-2 TaxID=2054168 RepID=UPI000C774FA9|nr:3D domain-containing protein [Bacillus sp. T33-2]PLR99515.1 hypothetical protein CVD19_00195 [Bacillus sp. T33-2]
MRNIIAVVALVLLMFSSIFVGNYYIKQNEELKIEIESKDKIIKQNEIRIHNVEGLNLKQRSEIKQLKEVINQKDQEINSLRNQIEQIKKNTAIFEVTAYTAGYESTGKYPGDKSYGITASGETVKEGKTIACPKSLDFGTTLAIENVGIRTCEDRGSKITEGKIDLYMDDLQQALAFGRKTLMVRILKQA